MKRILVGVDGSEPSLKAVQWAAELAPRVDATVSLLYVRAPVVLTPPLYGDVVAQYERAEAQFARDVLSQSAQEAGRQGAKVEQVELLGAPAEALSDAAKAPDVWMVAVGGTGRGAVSRLLLGSVADRLAHICPKPLVVVR